MTLKINDYQKSVIMLHLSKDNPKTQKELEQETGIDRRYVKEIIRQLRKDDRVPICSGNEGYWLARSEKDIQRTKARLWHEIMERLDLVQAMRDYPLEGQEVIQWTD